MAKLPFPAAAGAVVGAAATGTVVAAAASGALVGAGAWVAAGAAPPHAESTREKIARTANTTNLGERIQNSSLLQAEQCLGRIGSIEDPRALASCRIHPPFLV